MSILTALMLLFASTPDPRPSALRELVIDYEAGPGYVFQNENRYGATGTLYTAAEVGEQRNLFVASRTSAEIGLGERHTLVLLYAPLDLTTRATLSRDIDFNGVVFRQGEVVDHRYLFDGYRASYLYRLLAPAALEWDIGASLQIRNASVELRSVDAAVPRFAVESDIGLVFALKTRLRYAPRPNLWAMLDADFISTFGVFGRFSGALYDVSLTLGTPVSRSLDPFLRLRWLGGGADVQAREIHTWANLFFATAGLRGDLVALFE